MSIPTISELIEQYADDFFVNDDKSWMEDDESMNAIESQNELFPDQVQYINSLPLQTKQLLRLYTHQGDRVINSLLRQSLGDEIRMAYEEIFANSPPLEKTVTLYRASRMPIDRQHRELGIMSTTPNIELTGQYLNPGDKCCIYSITVPPGVRLLPIAHISMYHGEDEVLLGPGTILGVTHSSVKSPYEYEGDEPEIEIMVYDCIVIPPETVLMNSKLEVIPDMES